MIIHKKINNNTFIGDIMNGQREQSEFNDALGTMGRMNALFYNADTQAMALDPHGWFHTLRALRRELITDMTKEQDTEAMSYIQIIEEELPKFLRTIEIGQNRIQKKLYDALDNLETLLRTVHDNGGYKTKRSDDPRFAL